MKRYLSVMILLVIWQLAVATDKYAGEIFQFGSGVNHAAQGSTGLTDVNSPSQAYWNPALLAFNHSTQAEVMHAEEFGGLLQYDNIAAVWGTKTKMGLSISRIGINDIPLTRLQNDTIPISIDNKPYAYKKVNNNDWLIHFGLSRSVSQSFAYGISPKLAWRHLGEEDGYGFGVDAGLYYRINSSFSVGAKATNLISTVILWDDGTNETAGMGVDLETAYNRLVASRMLTIRTRAEILTEGREEAAQTSMGPISIDWHAGVAYQVHRNVELAAGYDAGNITAGMTLKISWLRLNYAYESATDQYLDSSQRMSLGVEF